MRPAAPAPLALLALLALPGCLDLDPPLPARTAAEPAPGLSIEPFLLIGTPCIESPRHPTVCRVGNGACQRTGAVDCRDGVAVCTVEPGPPGVEVCGPEPVDEDCDGLVDEGLDDCCPEPDAHRPCGLDRGVCHRAEQTCGADFRWGACPGTADRTDEVCDGVDDDCDGRTDEGLSATPERCDGADNDCDGLVDEGLLDPDGLPLGAPCTSGFGVCARDGRVACTAEGEAACDAVPADPVEDADVDCDGVDDDCDGVSDERPPCNGIDLTRYAGFEDGMPPGWVGLPAGVYVRGADARDAHLVSNNYEEPLHTVDLRRDLLVGRTEVTQAQFAAVMGYNPSLEPGPDRPVERVSWWEAIVFANRLSAREGLGACYVLRPPCTSEDVLADPCGRADATECRGHFRCDGVDLDPRCDGYRLPTDAEWEAAVRAGDGRFWFGNDLARLPEHERCATGADTAFEVMSLPEIGENPLGLYDTLGNVREWVFDVLSEHPDVPPDTPVVDPVVEWAEGLIGQVRVVRGGYFGASVRNCRATLRSWDEPATRQAFLGFRLVRALPDAVPPSPR